ncbi:uncharacterized protein LOC132262588 [Phlebotomus argentipes]|uniref:uncharacterized protein LOC132262588 n=1 Tax=Phlebotomus argentipes TaxID=94469 RepID=UPI002892F6A3|nr:uncharacterized protein LOC132262588 [Phlebotomus argentipes]
MQQRRSELSCVIVVCVCKCRMFTSRYNSELRTWSGRHLAPFHHESVSLGRALYYALSYSRNRVAQISDDSGLRVTDGELCDQMLAIAGNLRARGATRQQLIAVVAKNSHLIAPTVFAAFYLAIPVNTLDPNYSVDEIVHMFAQTRPSIVFCDHDNHATVQKAVIKMASGARIITFGPRIAGVDNIEDYVVQNNKEDPANIEDVDAETCALILCSSGTTGMSKGVSLTHQHLLYLFSYQVLFDFHDDARMLCFSSLYWLSGIAHLLLTTFLGITRIITPATFSVDLFLNIIEKYQATHVLSTPVQLAGVLESPRLTRTTLASVREYIVGGSVVPKDKWERIQTFVPNGFVLIVYGMSEVGFATRQVYRTNKYCVGKLAPDLQLRIVDENGQNCLPGETGEICFKPRFRFLGYYGNAAATRDMIDDAGWVHTGDIGRMDEDGDLHIVDRQKEILKYCNHHVSPSEVEQVIFGHAEVAYACVVGIPDPVCSDLPAAVVVRKEGAVVTEEDIARLVASRLSDPKHLRGGVYFVDSLPLTPSGKVIKGRVKQMALELFRARHH